MRSMTRTRRALSCALAVAIVSIGCTSGGDKKKDGGGGGNGGGSVSVKAEEFTQLVFKHVKDDNAEPSGARVYLLFEPNGKADLYAAHREDQLTYSGTWSASGKHLKLDIAEEDVKAHVDADVDMNAAKVTLPFRVFDTAAGSSEWTHEAPDPTFSFIPFRTAVFHDDASRDDGAKRATAWLRAAYHVGGNDSLAGSGGGLSSTSPPASAEPTGSDSGTPAVSGSSPNALGPLVIRRAQQDDEPFTGTSVERVDGQSTGVRVYFKDGPPLSIPLWSWAAPPATTPLALQPAPFANDPRLHLDPKPSGDTSGDPSNKTAVLIAGLKSRRWISYVPLVGNGFKFVANAGSEFELGEVESTLKDRGWSVEPLYDEAASVDGIIKAFDKVKNPGLVLINAHGMPDGEMLTGELLGTELEASKKAAFARFTALKKEYSDFPDDALFLMGVEQGMDPKDSAFFLSVMPPFWKWLREKRGVAFSSTFFYVGACLTDTTPDLREAIQAKFYTAFNVTIPAVTAGRIFRYMVKLLARPTRSAEEVFYNVIRVVNTGQMAFKEDKILDGVLPAEHSPKGSTATPKLLFDPKGDFAMNAYFTQGGTVKPTKGVGFLDTSSYDLGQLWWLTFAGRWGQDVAQGAKNLGECYTKFWSQGRNGGLASPYCNAANTGSPPKQGEVGYAQYLLTGHAGAGVSGTVPRWTMNESAS